MQRSTDGREALQSRLTTYLGGCGFNQRIPEAFRPRFNDLLQAIHLVCLFGGMELLCSQRDQRATDDARHLHI